ncbi:CHASE domain-containing protein [Antarctobacter sp.]|uniref:CHASE domain-containing protein n=1 Tax=Antarctobacter sp. TaxID=1872577 RepID=UPI002B27BEBA|nr:CHASE domain-containing protein [Antarctobacter sp.]
MDKSLEKRSGGISALHIVIVALSLAMTVGAWLYSKHQVDTQVKEHFEAAKDRAIGLIVDRMSRYEDALQSGVALVDASNGRTSHTEWRNFANSLKIEDKYPGVNGIGVIYYVDRTDLSQFQSARAAEGREFSIFPEHVQEFLLPITYIEPEDINAAAIGLDVAHETNRRTGLLASRDKGMAQITGPIVLVQDSGNTPGFLFFTPFYEGGTPATVKERQERFIGVVYAPFVVKKLVEGLLSKDLREVRFSIRDGAETIYDEHSSDDPLNDDNPMFQETVDLEMYGRTWSVDIRTNKAFRLQNGSGQPTLILLGGLIIEILVISMLALLARSNRQAHAYAHQLTNELRAKTEHLEHANGEIEQFVYIASHDLKTPVRGIGFLADVIEEDIEEIIGPLEKHTEIKMHFNMIRDRVNRMNDLTKGIMEYSRIGNYGTEVEPSVPVRKIVEDCVADFEVDPVQIRLTSVVDVIDCDSQNFRRVLENLIGNAFKYHPNPRAALIDLNVEDLGDRIKVSVKDDGKGIAPEFHDRIFGVFQTLRKKDEPESTGIGLAIVKKAVLRHGFDISVSSSEGEGAEFTFYWPKRREDKSLELGRVA